MKTSRAAKTPNIIVSSTSTSAKNVFMRRGSVPASFHDASRQTGTSTAARATITRPMPSTPTAYETPNCGIHE